MFMGQRFHVPTRLRTAAPDIAEEWDAEKNPGHLYPEIVGVGHMEPVWWKCKRCHHRFSMSVEKRVVRGGGCPACIQLLQQRPHNSTKQLRSAEATTEVEEDELSGERNPALRAKRQPMFTIRTKY